MADKKAPEKRNFYKKKIFQIEKDIKDEKSFEQFSWYELNEWSDALTSAHDKFELKCLSICYDSELKEEELTKLNKENTSVDQLCIKLKAKLKERIVRLKSIEKADVMEKEHALENKEHALESQEAKKEKKKRQLQNTWGVFNGKIDAFSQFYANFTTAMSNAKDLSDE